MKNFFIIIFLLGLFYLFKKLPGEVELQALSTLLLGIVLLAAYLFADLIKRIRLPRLTGYMLLGIVLGPIGFQYLNIDLMDQLNFLKNLALSFIALTAGGEFEFRKYQVSKKRISFILIFQSLIVFIGISFFLIILSNYIPLLASFNQHIMYGFALLFAATAVSLSPATTIGIIAESEAQGKNTDTILTVTILNSFFLVLFFPVILIYCKLYLVDSGYETFALIKTISFQIFSSIGIGIIIGVLIIWYLKKIKVEISIFLFCVAVTISEFTQLFGIEILLTSIIAGIIVRNFSSEGKGLITEIEMFSLPLYIIFFCLTGASLHFDVLTTSIVLTFLLITIRTVFIYLGTYIGAYFAGENNLVKTHSWMGYIGQAGIALGLGMIIERNFPGGIGQTLLTIIIATVVINELIGPILFKYFLIKSKEARED
jgi:Kef-type K+ transport system membrane component KefB